MQRTFVTQHCEVRQILICFRHCMTSNRASRNAQAGHANGVLESIRQIVRSLRVASRASEKENGLSAAQLLVLQQLNTGNALSLNELAARTQTHQSSASVVVTKLVSRGFIVRARSKRDARRIELSLTAAARKVIHKTPHAAQDRLVKALGALSAGDIKQLSALLKKVVLAAGLESAS